MTREKKMSAETIKKCEDVHALRLQGRTLGEACREIRCGPETYYRWRTMVDKESIKKYEKKKVVIRSNNESTLPIGNQGSKGLNSKLFN